MRDFSELNLNEGGRPVNRAPPSAEEVAAFEHEFGVTLPRDYLQLLSYSNGGCPEADSIAPMGRTDIAKRAVNRFFHLNEDHKGPSSLWAATRAWRPILGEKRIPIAADGGGNPFILDLSRPESSVSTCLIDDHCALVEVATSFADFIDRLEIDPDMI